MFLLAIFTGQDKAKKERLELEEGRELIVGNFPRGEVDFGK